VQALPSTSSDNQEETEKKDEKADSNVNNEDTTKEDNDIDEENTRAKRRGHNPKGYLLAQKEVYKSAQQLDFTYVSRITRKKKFLSRSF